MDSLSHLGTSNNIILLRKHVHQLPLALITPLGSDYNGHSRIEP